MRDDLDMGNVDMLVCIDKMRAEYAGEEFWRRHRILLGLNVDSVLDRISGYDWTIVRFGVSRGSCQHELSLMSALPKTYESSISPSSKAQMVISVTVWTPVCWSRWTL